MWFPEGFLSVQFLVFVLVLLFGISVYTCMQTCKLKYRGKRERERGRDRGLGNELPAARGAVVTVVHFPRGWCRG